MEVDCIISENCSLKKIKIRTRTVLSHSCQNPAQETFITSVVLFHKINR